MLAIDKTGICFRRIANQQWRVPQNSEVRVVTIVLAAAETIKT